MKYGPVYTIWAGYIPIVTVNDYDLIIKMFVRDGDTYADRAGPEAINKVTRKGNLGIIESSGSLWKDQRRFAMRVLRDFGLGKNKMQARVRNLI
jgi:cytochrome P450 family 33